MVQVKNFNNYGSKFPDTLDVTLLTSLREEKENS